MATSSVLEQQEPAPAAAPVTELTAQQWTEFMRSNADSLIVVDYYTRLCGPCLLMRPQFEEMATQFEDVRFAKFDCHASDEQSATAHSVGVRALPTFHLYRTLPSGSSFLLAEVKGAKPVELKRAIARNRRVSLESLQVSKPGDSYWRR